MSVLSKRTVIVNLEDNKVTSCKVFEEDNSQVDMSTEEAASYLLDYTDIIQVSERYDEIIEQKMRKERVEGEFYFRRGIERLLLEASYQMTPDMTLKMYIASPILALLARISSLDCKQSFWGAFFKKYFIKPIFSLLRNLFLAAKTLKLCRHC